LAFDRQIAFEQQLDVVISRPGSGGTRTGNASRPGFCDAVPYTCGNIVCVSRCRSDQSVVITPPNPPPAVTTDHM
jgi:hypothetical protein